VYARLTQFRWCFSAATLRPQPLQNNELRAAKP